jgi:hypothetical protein
MRRLIPFAGLLCIVALGACSSDDAPASAQCEVGRWKSTAMTAPSQAALGEVTPAGGGDGIDITFGEDKVFKADFGPMQPTTATFEKAGQQGTLQTTLSGLEQGTWSVGDQSKVVATTEDFTTARGTVEMILGETVPPVFDQTFQEINETRMLDGAQVGVFTVTSCEGDDLTMSSPFPGGEIVITATRQG